MVQVEVGGGGGGGEGVKKEDCSSVSWCNIYCEGRFTGMDGSLLTSDQTAAPAASASAMRPHRPSSAVDDTPTSRMRALQRALQAASHAISLEKSGDAAAAERFASCADELKSLAALASLGDACACPCRTCVKHMLQLLQRVAYASFAHRARVLHVFVSHARELQATPSAPPSTSTYPFLYLPPSSSISRLVSTPSPPLYRCPPSNPLSNPHSTPPFAQVHLGVPAARAAAGGGRRLCKWSRR